jgi:tetratricopeptide (TPR) repeat protein
MHDYHTITINGGTRTDLSFIKYMASSTLVNVYNGAYTTIGGIEDGSGSTSPAINCSNTSANIMGVNITDYDFGVWAASNSSINVTTQSYFCNNLIDLITQTGGYIYASHITLSAPWPQSISGNISNGGDLEPPCTQKIGKASSLTSNSKDDLFPVGLINLNSEYLQLLNRINLENRDNPNFSVQEYKPAFLDLISRYKLLLKKDSNNKTVNAVLSKLAHCYYTIDEKTLFKSYLDNLITSSSFSQFLPYIKRHYINFYVEDGDFESAISIAEQVFNSTIVDEDVKCEMLYEEGVIFKYYLNDIDKAMAAFAQIVDKYPNNNLYYFAKTELESENAFIAKKTDTINNEEVSEYATAVYPNPFNPSTKITYSIPERGNVILKVYDILGREIVQLVNEVKESGNYQVNFDGSNLNSGVYFYTIESGKYKASKKLLLVK